LDQLGFWGNLGVSLLGFAGALSILLPYGAEPLNLPAAVTAIVVGSLLGALILGISLVLGATTGAPAMVLLRGLLGAKASFLPTALNIAQCLGWAVFELLVIAAGLQALTGGAAPRWVCVLAAGVVTTALTVCSWSVVSVRAGITIVIGVVVVAPGMTTAALAVLDSCPSPSKRSCWGYPLIWATNAPSAEERAVSTWAAVFVVALPPVVSVGRAATPKRAPATRFEARSAVPETAP
jgi:hypothetical protein